ncbi:agmatinase family protein [Leptothoe kymatousa]|uniref:Agmatinase family protein n=1 Tax=Leptothoe kymatousa TAU-MAC 1615 TaxID=2364775 RepID=A0ABS5Y6R7_9CYAN|nr:agmatinase family protein [Leptothoe kymatousa]MBT9313526.1 agmatinase family protein [Leptothoe kymatousa TAU-MAC 1615]
MAKRSNPKRKGAYSPCSIAERIANFDPGGVGAVNGNVFGFPHDYAHASTVVIGVPWDVTTSYQDGTCQGPAAILRASPQLDFYDFDHPEAWRQGIYMLPIPAWLLAQNKRLRPDAIAVIRGAEQGISPDEAPELGAALSRVNQGCDTMTRWVQYQTQVALDQNKKVIVIGGDHSVPLGTFRALAQQYADFGILHVDAHGDLRHAYEGFQQSHASIMFNALQLAQISKLVQVGIRDISHGEINLIQQYDGRIVTYLDTQIKRATYAGQGWLQQCQAIVRHLPQHVYISCDVDGLDPKLCPHTGTPVPGGLNLEEVYCLWREVVRSGRHIVGCDICETGNHEWDGNVSARILYKLFSLMNMTVVSK